MTVAMTDPRSQIEALRREIDAIDDTMHELLMRRWKVAHAVGQVKAAAEGDRPRIRPAREAWMHRRRAARHDGQMPLTSLLRLWREIIGVTLCMEGPFHVHVCTGGAPDGAWDLARATYGSYTPMTAHEKPSQAVHACATDPHALAILPVPEGDFDTLAWWTQLAPAGQPGPRVLARLPYVPSVPAVRHPSSLVIGSVELEPTDEDVTLIVVEVDTEVSRARLQTLLREAGLKAQIVSAARTAPMAPARFFLIEADGFVPGADPRLGVLRAADAAIARAYQTGGYAVPLT